MEAPNGKKVEYNFLGNSGLKVSNLCLGAMTFGTMKENEGIAGAMNSNKSQLDEKGAHKLMDRYVEMGGNFIDTANMYSAGNSERFIGTWLKKKNRDDVIIATKARFPCSAADMVSPNGFGLSRRLLVKACEGSLSRLQTDYIDLYQAHMWDNGTPLEETLRTFDDLIRCGKIRYFGFSNVCGWQLQKIVDIAKHLGLNPCVSLQQQYSLIHRHSEYEEFAVCENEGIGVLPWSPLKGGMLTGKYKRDKTPDNSSRAGFLVKLKNEGKTQMSYWDELANDDSYWNLIDVLEKIAKKHGKTVAQVSLRWLLQQKVVSSVIIGATSIQQLEDNMGAGTGWELTDEEMKEISDASQKPTIYPYSFTTGAYQDGRSNPFKKF